MRSKRSINRVDKSNISRNQGGIRRSKRMRRDTQPQRSSRIVILEDLVSEFGL